jgi:hydroxymethylpyrimidine pyrophosphatase-like HAD family hydrolase
MSDIHTGTPLFKPEFLAAAVDETNAYAPDLVAVAGDLTAAGYRWEFEEAKSYLDRIECPNVVVIMGNHDAKNVGYQHFEDLFGQRARSVTFPVPEGEVKLVALDSSKPDLAEEERPKVKEIVDALLAEHPDELKVTPGKMVYEIQPKIDWDKGKAVLYLLEALELDRDDVVPVYLGDDITDEHAFEALAGRGIGIFVGRAEDPEVGGRSTYLRLRSRYGRGGGTIPGHARPLTIAC